MLMFAVFDGCTLASMSEIDPRADTPRVNWSELGVNEFLPTGTVTLLLADVEGSTRLWETRPEEMAAAVEKMDLTVADLVAAYDGVRPVEQGEGDSFVAAFGRASDAIACALALQRADLAPIRLRVGVHTGEVRLRGEGNYIGATINRAARIRDLAHGGQTVISGTTEDLVLDSLPDDVWLMALGNHRLRDVPRPERVLQLCHAGVRNDFPSLRTSEPAAAHNLPPQFTTFVGRGGQIDDVRLLLADNRLVTLTGAGGAGKTRLAVEVARLLADVFGDGVCCVDLAPVTHPDGVAVAVARAIGLPDQPGASTVEIVLRFLRDRRMLIVLDNCEHLLDACAELVVAMLGGCPGLTVMATSREPISVAGELTWRVPSLSLADEAIDLFVDRARRARPDFSPSEDDAATLTEICERLDGMPLAIELAAARVRALSLTEILNSLHDRFRLLTGGARTAVRRQQTLRASVDWSHALLTEPERVLFRRLAVFVGGFDIDAAQAVSGGGEVHRFQVLDQLTLLVDKSLVVAEDVGRGTRYRLLETVRQYALEKLGESGEADVVRTGHRDYYAAIAAQLDAPAGEGHKRCLERAEVEVDNLRAALAWSRENADVATALQLASSLQPLWFARGRLREGAAWFDAILRDDSPGRTDVPAVVRARALADKAMLDAWKADVGVADSMDRAQQALQIARETGDDTLLVRALTACGCISGYDTETARRYLAEASDLARVLGDEWRLSQILDWQALGAFISGDPLVIRGVAEEGRDVANAIGNPFDSRHCRMWLGWAQMWQGDLSGAIAQFRDLGAEAHASRDIPTEALAVISEGRALAYHGDTDAARVAATLAIKFSAELGWSYEGPSHASMALAALAAGDVAAATHAGEAAWARVNAFEMLATHQTAQMAQAALANDEVLDARQWADKAVSVTTGWYRLEALTISARVAMAQGEPGQAERDAVAALACGSDIRAYLGIPDPMECLAALAAPAGSHQEAARLFGAAEAIRQRTGGVRFQIYQSGYESAVAALRTAMDQASFESAWAQGAGLSIEEAIAYAQRGRGERKRSETGWDSLTPTEHDVVALVSEGLANKDVATRLFISPRTVQTHLTHVYTKLGLTSRMQLAQEAARHKA
jgi:predicted ATPase/class 3 adenylate cyclase/DNA-binding CsgD family transcriptional regulator